MWGIKLKKVDLSWPAVFSSSQNPSWIELNLLFKPWIELTRALHFWPKVDLSWPIIYSSSYNPSWIELNFLSSPWIELTQILHICPRLDLTQVEPTNSSQLRVDPKLKKINFFQVNSRKSWKNLNFFKNLF